MTDSEDGKESESTAEGTIKAVTGLVKEVPIYEDAIKPVAKETGKALQTVGQAVNAALVPVRGLVWGIDQIEDFVKIRVTEKLKKTPQENIQSPDPSVAGPVLESLRYSGHKESLSDLYASLLATSMDSSTARNAHPGFVEIIRNMSSDEAKIVKFLASNNFQPVINIRRKIPSVGGGLDVHKYVSFVGALSGCENIDLVPSCFDNLIRLGVINVPYGKHLKREGAYDGLKNDKGVIEAMDKINSLDDSEAESEQTYVELTELGKLFSRACVNEKENL